MNSFTSKERVVPVLIMAIFYSTLASSRPTPATVYEPAADGGLPVHQETETHRSPSVASAELWEWVREKMDLRAHSIAPAVEFASPEELTRIRSGGDARKAGGLEVLAIYDKDRTRILLSTSLLASDPFSQSVVVHELVHHAQALKGKTFACAPEAEAEAYRLQERWLRDQGVDFYATSGLDRLTVLVLTLCGM